MYGENDTPYVKGSTRTTPTKTDHKHETFVICKTCRPTIVNGRMSIVHNHDEDCAMFLVPTES